MNTSRRATCIFPLPSNHSTSQTHQLPSLLFLRTTTQLYTNLTIHQPTFKMAEHNYKFNITMTCGGCSGAVERVLKKLEGKSSLTRMLLLSSICLPILTISLLTTPPHQVSKNSTSPSTPRPLPSRQTRASTTAPCSRRSRRPARPSTLARPTVLPRLCRWSRRIRDTVAFAREAPHGRIIRSGQELQGAGDTRNLST